MSTTSFIDTGATPQSVHKQVMENQLLARFRAPDLALLAPHFRQVSLNPGSVLHEPETLVETVYFPLSGAVSLFAVMKGGEAAETTIVGHEGAVGLSGHNWPWQAHVRAVVQAPGIAKAIAPTALWAVVAQSEYIRDLMARYTGKLLQQTQQIAACNALHSVEERIASWLLQLSDRIDSTELPITQELMGQLLGVRRTTVTIIAQKLQHEHLIRYRRGRIVITNPTGLRQLACECYETCRQADALFHRPILSATVGHN